ncbi:DUF5074 domain-containing protein [Paraflavitalea pollutisoli]|uniref:DUF5074 domain-containing protein n=1 Tax=Paraflavitalea pollutisoli TaxID=3034143 RepID=UPI0023EC4B08|nr:DUF5074 domain-containing protein [Paraflavitalea sp. H1-2-19X]
MMYQRGSATLSVCIGIAMLSMTACKKDDYTQLLPQITDNGLATGKTSIIAGDSVRLYPKLNERTNTTYQWLVNQKNAGTDSVYTFKTDSAGTYLVQFTAANTSGQISTQYEIQVSGKYEHGILLVNEGWFGHENGSVNFYRYGQDTVETMVYHHTNPGKDLGVTTQYGAVHNGRLYLVSKQGPLVVADAKSLKETGRITTLPANGRAFLGLDNNNGLLSTASGIYKLDLNTLTVGDKIPNADGQIGAMLAAGDHLFIISQSKGLLILRKSDFGLVKNITGINQGLSKTPDGALWVAGGSNLVKINTTTLDTNRIVLPFSLGSPWSAWNVGTVTTSTTENAVFLAQTMSWGAGGTKLYKYKSGDISSVAAPIATLPAGKEFYGGAVGYYAAKNELVVTAVQSGYGQNYQYNSLYFYDAANGSLKKTINYQHFYFPALMLFN